MPWSRRQRETGGHRLGLLTGDPAEGVLLGLCAALVLISALRAADITDRLWLAACLAAGLSLPIGRLLAAARNASSRPRPNARTILGAALCLAGALIVMSTPDTSWDSMAYHFPAVLSIASGWNPLRGPTENWKVNVYPNGAWTLLAAAGALMGSLDAGRILKLVLLGSAAWLVWRLLSRWVEQPRRRFLLTVALVANPVVTAQLWTFYLDDLIYLFALCVFCLCVEFLRNPLPRTIAPLCAAVILLSLTKLYGAYYASAAILAGMACVGPPRLSTARIAVPTLIVTLAAIGLIGWRPFVTGWMDGQLLGAASYREAPPNLQQVARPLAFPVSMASRTGGTRADPVQPKVPFSITLREIYFMAVPEPRAGGFGPFYSGTCLLALILWAGLVSSSAGPDRSKRAVLAAGISVSTVVLAACLFFPMNWWARFVPIGWVLPLVPAVIAETLGLTKRVWWDRLSLVLIALCLANSGLALGNAARTLHGWWNINGQFRNIARDAQGIGLTPDSDGGMHRTFIYWLELAGYNPRLLEPSACQSAEFSFRSIRFCAFH